MLDDVDLSLALSKRAYKYIHPFQRERLYELQKMAYETGLSSVIVFEGWDAAGKGTTIQELTNRLDPRGFKVHPIQAPRTEEQEYPWLWRFWMKIPRQKQIAIFDRSWYGRLTIERVEELTPIPDWIRAYEEINEFERTLADDGTVFIKFWLHISRKEQLRRFLLLSSDPLTNWQVTAEDWERHRKYSDYLAAVHDMLENTHTPYAPWTITPSTDKNFRIYQVFKVVIDTLETALDVEPTAWQSLPELEAAATPKEEAEVGTETETESPQAEVVEEEEEKQPT